jgi:class 3 adenylate cyclase/tetratricopeptide (TPR) repeat protein
MRCPDCQYESAADASFCERCGARLGARCVSCGESLSPGARFCRHCGIEQSGDPTRRLAGERRQLTALFCDLVGSTDLARRIDPEELRETLSAYHDACSEAVGRFDGHVAQYLGDGVLAYFGYPRAHEDDAERAVRAGLAIQASLAELNRRRAEFGAEPIMARIGIHTGLVVVMEMGDPERPEPLALGDPINVASRLEGLAHPGGVLISHATQRLVTGLFVMHDLGTPALKGVSEPIRVYAVEGSSGVGPRFGPSVALTPLKGRDRELAQLIERWEEGEEGFGQVVALSGEPGIGKSRLVHAFREQLRDVPHFTLELGCSPLTSGSAFQPLIELLEVGLAFGTQDAPQERMRRLESAFGGLPGLPLEQVVPFLGALLGLPPSPRFPLPHMSAERQREKTLEAVLATVRVLATRQPLLLVCEDLHWSDPSTLELLARLVDEAPRLPLFVLLTFRTEFELPGELSKPHVFSLALDRLGRVDTRALVEAAAGDDSSLPAAVVEEIAQRAEGVPLFAEELARSVAGTEPVGGRDGARARGAAPSVPATLQDSLMARLDRLEGAKPLAQLGATLGRHFSYELIEAVADLEPRRLRRGLAQLVTAQVLQQQGSPPEATYRFRHSLFQDTAYESQLKSARRALHARIATMLEDRFRQRVAAEPEVLARHSAEAGRTAQAVAYYQQAGGLALTRFANAEAVDYFARALGLLEALPDDGARQQQEIALRLALAEALAALCGYEHPETVRARERMETLCDALGGSPQQLPALLGLTLHHVNRGQLPKAREYAERLLAIAEPLGAAPLLVAGHMIKGTASLTTATVPEACHHLQKAIEIARTAQLEPPTAAFQIDALTVAYCTYAIGLAVSGWPESSRRAANEGLRRARELHHPRTHASALANCAMAFHMLEDLERTAALADECLEVLAGRGFHTVECSARVLGGWARARLGDPTGIEGLEEGLVLAGTSGTLGGLAQFHFAAVDIYTREGRFDRALADLERGAGVAERTGEWMAFAPQVPLLRARLLLASGAGGPEEAEPLLEQSLDLWQRSQANWLALGAALELGRVALQTGHRQEARKRLAALVAGFSEGLDSPRLREARALLDALG